MLVAEGLVGGDILAGALAIMLAQRGQANARAAVLIGAWAALLAATLAVAGRAGLGTLLTAAFVLQVTPSIGIHLPPPASASGSRSDLRLWSGTQSHRRRIHKQVQP